MFRINLGIFVLALALSGCAEKVIWIQPELTNTEAQRQFAQCEYESTAATQNVDYGFRSIFGQALDQGMRRKDLMEKCLRAKGFSPQKPPE